jgi:hypothetical protein
MTSPKTCILAAVAGVLSASAAFADTDVQKQIADLQSQVAQLEARQAAGSKEMAATIDAVLRDAERRSQLAADMGSGAGYDGNGFFIRGGTWELRPEFLFQFMSISDWRDNTTEKGSQTDSGYEIHRAEFGASGTAFTKDLTYKFLWNTDSEGGGVYLLDAYVVNMLNDNIGLRSGQYTANVTHEEWVGDGKQLAAERSLFDAALAGYSQRVQGTALLYGNYNDKNPINAEVAFEDGANSMNTNYLDRGNSYPLRPNWGMYGRAEYKASGSWVNYQDFTAKGVKKDNLLVIGGAVAYDQFGDGNLWGGTADVMFKTPEALSIYGAVFVRYIDGGVMDLMDDDSRTDWGALVQVAYLINPQIELFGRYSYIKYDGDLLDEFDDSEAEDNFHEITLGMNYYMGKNGDAGHRAKITVDVNILPNGSPGQITNLGYIGDSNFDAEINLRAQFQLML